MRLPKRLNLNQRFMLPIFGILFFACTVLVLTSFFYSMQASRKVVTDSLLQTASATANSLENWVLDRKIDLAIWSGDAIYRDALIAASSNLPARADVSYRLSQTAHAYGYYKNVSLANLEGKIIASSDSGLIGSNLDLNQDFLINALSDGYAITDAVKDEATGGAVMHHALTINPNGQDIGLLIATLSLKSLNEQQFLPASLGSTGRVILMNRSKVVFLHPDAKRIFQLSYSDLLQNARLRSQHEVGTVYSYANDAQSRLAVVARVRGTGWTVVTDVSEREIEEPAVNAGVINITVAALMFVLFGLTLYLLVRSITVPLSRMSDTFSDVARGDFEKTLSIGRDDELGKLAQSFESMRNSIREKIAELNEEIVARVKVEWELRQIKDVLADRVRERTESLSQEIAEREQAEQVIRENEARLRQMLEHSPIGVGISRVDTGEILYTNMRTTDMFGYPQDEFVGKMPENTWVDTTLRDRFVEEFSQQGFAAGREVLLKRKNGEQFWVLLTWDSIRYDDEPCILFWVYDIDVVKKTQQQLIHARDEAQVANQAKSDFLAKMSHELRTPLNAIIGISEMLEEDAEESRQSSLIEPLSRIHHAGDHLLTLIDEILDISRIEAGRIDLTLTRFKISMLMDNAASTAGSLVQRNGNKMVIHTPKKLGAMLADQTRVRQILYNLLSNAAKFTENGEITLSADSLTRNGKDYIRFVVADTGIGIREDQIGRLFKEFSQANRSISQKYGGTGLGLAICSKLCGVMGGSIEVSSVFGEGSRFVVELPRDAKYLASNGGSKA